jgi:hypothetical protein
VNRLSNDESRLWWPMTLSGERLLWMIGEGRMSRSPVPSRLGLKGGVSFREGETMVVLR